MKIRHLRIDNYGVFRRKSFDFGNGGFQLIYGENEAGKSTLLQLIRELLFGFPHRSRYRFEEADGEMSATARVVFFDRQEIEFTRRKGRKATVHGNVVGAPETIVDEAFLRQRLGNANANLYKNIFAFSLNELQIGESLLEQEKIRETLYGSGLGGLTRIDGTRKLIEEELQALFSPRASTKTINRLLTEIVGRKRELRDLCLRPREYSEREQVLRGCEEKSETIGQELEALRLRRDVIAAMLKAWEPRQRLQHLSNERESLPDPRSLPEDGASRLSQIEEETFRTSSELEAIDNEIEVLVKRQAKILPRPELLQKAEQIQSLHQEIDKIRGFRRDIPLRRDEARRIRDETARSVARIHPEGKSGNPAVEPIGTPLLDQLEDLAEEREDLDRQRLHLGRDAQTRQERISAAKDRHDRLASVESSDAHGRLLHEADRHRLDRRELEEIRKNLESTEESARSLRRDLVTTCPELPEDPSTLPLPRPETIEEFSEKFRDLDDDLKRTKDKVSEAETARARCEREISRQKRESAVPDRAEVEAARIRRDRAIDLLLRRPALSPEELEDSLLQWDESFQGNPRDAVRAAVQAADEMADIRWSNADVVAHKAQKDEELIERRAAEAIARKAQRTLAAARNRLEAEWLEAWSGSGIVPLTPRAMVSWAEGCRALIARFDETSRFREEEKTCLRKITEFEEAVARITNEPTTEIDGSLHRIENDVRSARDAASKRKLLSEQIFEDERALAILERKQADADRALETWQVRFATTIAPLRFPADWRPSLAVKVARDLDRLAQHTEQAQSLDHRIERMEAETAEFEKKFEDLKRSLDLPPTETAPEQTLHALHKELLRAQETETQQENLRDQVAAHRDRKGRLERTKVDLDRRLRELLKRGGSKTGEELRLRSEQADRARSLDVEIAELQRTIALLHQETADESFLEELRDLTRAQLERRLQEITEQAEALSRDFGEALKEVGTAKRRLDELDGTSQAAAIGGEVEGLRSQLGFAVDRYAPLCLAKALIRRAIEKFEREHQPEMLREVSRIFSTMTAGRYPSVRRKLDRSGTLLAVQEDGREKEPSQLSSGTREQLYLSVRLAYIQHYGRHTEPLPIVMDDVLVNFDDRRAQNTLKTLRDLGRTFQILFLTCHESTVKRARKVMRNLDPIRLEGSSVEHAGKQGVLPIGETKDS